MQTISEEEAMNYPRFDEEGNVLMGAAAKVRKRYVYVSKEEETSDAYYIERVLIFDDLFDDSFDYSRSVEEGWFYPDDDPREPWDVEPD